MTQLQPTAGHSSGAPVSPGAHWDRRTIAIVVGALVLMAAAFGLAIWLSSDGDGATETEVQSVAVEPPAPDVTPVETDASSPKTATADWTGSEAAPSHGATGGYDGASFGSTAVAASTTADAPSYGASGGYDATSFGGTTESVNPTEGYGASGGLDAASFD